MFHCDEVVLCRDKLFVVMKVVFIVMKQMSENIICYGFIATKLGNAINMLRVHHDESPFVAMKVAQPNNTYNLVQQTFEDLYKEGCALGFESSDLREKTLPRVSSLLIIF